MKDFPKRPLLVNYLLGLCTPGEEREVEYWLDKEPGNSALLQKVANEMGDNGSFTKAEKKGIKDDLFSELHSDKGPDSLKNERVSVRDRNASSIMAGRWLKVAAVILLMLTAGGVGFYYHNSLPGDKQSEVVLKTRTLSAGQKATLRFGDGSVIQLNAQSTLRYPSKFDSNKREVYLEGEAFFSVERDTTRPFIIHAGGTATQVLGTSLNIRAYEGEDKVQVAVVEGEVAVTEEKAEKRAGQEAIHISKNEWVTYHSDEQIIEKGQGDIWKMVAWKDDVLVFK